MFIAYTVMYYYSPNLTGSVQCNPDDTTHDNCVETGAIPRWVYLLNGVCMLAYQTLDNMDGKQARRTGSSSPLGMLFDHGCDAINSPLGSLNWCVAMGIGAATPFVCFWTLVASAIPFYISTWEEYYTGSLVLPYINGPSEGLILGASLSFVSFFHGPHFWHGRDFYVAFLGPGALLHNPGTDYFCRAVAYMFDPTYAEAEFRGCCNYELLLCLAAFCALQEFFLKAVNIVHKFGLRPLLNLLPFLTLLSCSLACGSFYPLAVRSSMRSCMLLFGVLFVDAVTALMLAHMTEAEPRKARVVLLPLLALAAAGAAGALEDGDGEGWQKNAVTGYLAAAVTFVAFKFTVVVAEITECLGIYCFDISTKRVDRVEYVEGRVTRSSNGKKRA